MAANGKNKSNTYNAQAQMKSQKAEMQKLLL